MANPDVKCVSASAVDWLTVTCKDQIGGNNLLSTYNRHKEGSQRGTRFFGFDCIKDENGLTWGKRVLDGLFIFIASGDVAATVWRQVVPVATKVTRIDLAVDVWLDEPRDQVKQSSRVVLSPSLEARLKYTYITGVRGKSRSRSGDTLYVGSRHSEQFGRFYDKGLQTETADPGKWLRYEVEYKSDAAFQMARKAIELAPGALGEFISCTVFDWFFKRTVPPLFNPDTDTPGLVIRSQMKQTTKERKLAWLRSQVRPTVQYLFQQGMRNEALRALDIDLVKIPDEVYNGTPAHLSADNQI
jgi:hypothetical protein